MPTVNTMLPILSPPPPDMSQNDATLTALSIPPPGVLPLPAQAPAFLDAKLLGLPITVKQAGIGAIALFLLSKVL